MQQFISCLLSFEWLEPHPTDWKKLIPTPHIQTEVKSMTQFLNDVLMSGKAEVGRLAFNPHSGGDRANEQQFSSKFTI